MGKVLRTHRKIEASPPRKQMYMHDSMDNFSQDNSRTSSASSAWIAILYCNFQLNGRPARAQRWCNLHTLIICMHVCRAY